MQSGGVRGLELRTSDVSTKLKELVTFAPKDRKHWNYWRQGGRRRFLLDQWEIRIAADLHANDTLWGRRRDEAVWGVSVFTLLLSSVCTRKMHCYILAEKLKNRRMVRKYYHCQWSTAHLIFCFHNIYAHTMGILQLGRFWVFKNNESSVLKHLLWK